MDNAKKPIPFLIYPCWQHAEPPKEIADELAQFTAAKYDPPFFDIRDSVDELHKRPTPPPDDPFECVLCEHLTFGFEYCIKGKIGKSIASQVLKTFFGGTIVDRVLIEFDEVHYLRAIDGICRKVVVRAEDIYFTDPGKIPLGAIQMIAANVLVQKLNPDSYSFIPKFGPCRIVPASEAYAH